MSEQKGFYANQAYQLVLKFFEHDVQKTMTWFTTKNFLLGNITPKQMITLGRQKKLYTFVDTRLKDNYKL